MQNSQDRKKTNQELEGPRQANLFPAGRIENASGFLTAE
jgi:hypothetical protein